MQNIFPHLIFFPSMLKSLSCLWSVPFSWCCQDMAHRNHVSHVLAIFGWIWLILLICRQVISSAKSYRFYSNHWCWRANHKTHRLFAWSSPTSGRISHRSRSICFELSFPLSVIESIDLSPHLRLYRYPRVICIVSLHDSSIYFREEIFKLLWTFKYDLPWYKFQEFPFEVINILS